MNETIEGSMRTFWPSIPTEYSPRSSPALIFQASWDRSRISIFLAQSLCGADGVHVDLHVDLHAAPHVVRGDEVELFRPALSHDDLAERTHGVVAELVHGLDGDPRDGPVSLDPPAMFRLERGLEGEPQEVDVRVHLLVRNLKGARFLRRDDRLADLTGDLLRRADGRV